MGDEPPPKKQKLLDVAQDKTIEWVKCQLEDMEYAAAVTAAVAEALCGYTRKSLSEAKVCDLETAVHKKINNQEALVTALALSLYNRIHPELLQPPAPAP